LEPKEKPDEAPQGYVANPLCAKITRALTFTFLRSLHSTGVVSAKGDVKLQYQPKMEACFYTFAFRLFALRPNYAILANT